MISPFCAGLRVHTRIRCGRKRKDASHRVFVPPKQFLRHSLRKEGKTLTQGGHFEAFYPDARIQ